MLNTDLGADSCGVHIVENGGIEPDEKDYMSVCLEENMKYIYKHTIHCHLPSFCLHLVITCVDSLHSIVRNTDD